MENLLAKFKSIKPSEEFSESSKTIIFSLPQNQPRNWQLPNFLSVIGWKSTISLASALAIIIATTLLLTNQKSAPAIANNLDPDQLTSEAKNLDIQIQLSQAQYYQDSAKKINVALLETSDEKDQRQKNNKELDALLKELTL